MKADYKGFIGIYDDVYPQGYCQHLISEFERLQEFGAGGNRIQTENAPRHAKNDYQIALNFKGQAVSAFENKNTVDLFFEGLQSCYEEYISMYSVLSNAKIRASTMKMQKTPPGGGYHVWHGEQNNGDSASRVLVYMLYLNTLTPEEAGETEFLYQQQRYRPTENQMILWPAAYTHAHRGNTVFGERSKYIVTGWFYYE